MSNLQCVKLIDQDRYSGYNKLLQDTYPTSQIIHDIIDYINSLNIQEKQILKI